MRQCKAWDSSQDTLSTYRMSVKATYVSGDDINYALGQVIFSLQLNTVVHLCLWFNRQLQRLLELHDCLLYTTHWERDLLVISEANPWKALQRNHNKTPKELSKTVQHCAVVGACWHICPAFLGFLILRAIYCCSWIIVNNFITQGMALSAHPVFSLSSSLQFSIYDECYILSMAAIKTKILAAQSVWENMNHMQTLQKKLQLQLILELKC